MSYTKTIICEQSGLTLVLIDSMPDGNFSTFKSHPQIGNIHKTIEKYRSRTAKDVIAGGILLALNDCERFAHVSHYPPHIMGILNQELCQHDSEFLYMLYQKVMTFCYGKSIVTAAQFNLMQSRGKWGIVHAIKVLIGEPETIPSDQYEYGVQVVAAMQRTKSRSTLTKNHKKESTKLGNMNLDKVIARVQRLSRKCLKIDPSTIQDFEKYAEITLNSANTILPSYIMATPEKRDAMALLYKQIMLSFRETIYTDTQKRSFSKMIELLRNTDVSPVEVSDGAELDLSSLEI